MSCNCKPRIARGSTFTFTLTLPEEYDITNAKQIWVTFMQKPETKIDKDISDLTIDENKIIVSLDQAETLSLRSGSATMQTRILMADDKSLVQYPMLTWEVVDVLKDGVIE